jgi:hypothetical protein
MSKTYSANLIKKLIKQISGKIKKDDGDLIPEYTIKGRGDIWCFSPTERTMARISRGIPVYLIEEEGHEEKNQDGKCLIYTQLGGLYMIDCKELERIGFD